MTDQPASPAPAGQGADGATPPASPPAAASDLASPPGPPAPPPPPAFHTTFEDPAARGYVETKGWRTQADLLQSYQNLEKLRGVPADRLLTLPENMDDAEAMKPVYERLGLAAPASADEYGFASMEGADAQSAEIYSNLALKHGIPVKQAQAVFADILALSAETRTASLNEVAEETAAELGRLQAEWGSHYDANVEVARRAVRQFGFSQEELEAMETNIGAAAMYKRFNQIGRQLGEGAFIEGATKKDGFVLSADSARTERMRLMGDEQFMGKYLRGDPAAKDRMDRLNRIISGGGAGQ